MILIDTLNNDLDDLNTRTKLQCGHTTNFRSPEYCFKVIEANKEFSLRTLDRQTIVLK